MKSTTRLFERGGFQNKTFLKVVISTILFCGIFTSCENFLNGKDFKDNIDSAVEYANSPIYTIQIAADDGTGKFTIGEGDKSVKVTDTFKVGFQKKANYKFIKWTAVSKTDDNVSRIDCVSFKDETALETEVKIIKGTDDIKIKPLCELTMEFTSCIPTNNTKSGIERNSQIDLTFTNPLSENNDVSKIEITVEDNLGEAKDGKIYFQPPEIRDKKILIKSKIDNLIPVEQGELKTVRITIPADFKYIGAENEEKEIGSEMSYYYTVNYQTCDKLNLVYGVTEDDGGKFKVQNVYDESISLKYSLGETDIVIFKPAVGFKFIGWEYEDDGHILLDESVNEVINGVLYENGKSTEDNSIAVKIEVFNSSAADTNFLFKAKIIKIPSSNIQITSDYGKISPSGIAEYKEGEKVNLFFTADSDYQFIRWHLVDRKTGKEIENQDFVKFEDEKEFNTSFTFEKSDENVDFLIEPYCEVRPKVSFVLPQNGEKNIVRNRTIRIVFTKPIDADSMKDNLHIYEGVQRVIGGDLIYDKEDISEKVDIQLSETKKTLYIKLKENSLFNPSSYVSVDISKKLKDSTNATFENDYSLQFQTSNYVDSLAPKINDFKAGLNSNLTNLTVLGQSDDAFTDISNGSALTKSRYTLSGTNANAITINDTNQNNYLNFYIDAGDIAGAKDVAGSDVVESNVKSILYRISRYKTNADGKLYKDETFPSDTQYIPYRSADYSDDTMSVDGKSFKTLTGKDVGCVATYNLNQLEDGLYRFDIATEDMDGNNGLEEEYYSRHQNGYKSVFVVKDTKTLETGTPQWINSSNDVDSDYVFKRIANTNIEKILRIPYGQSYFGVKTIELDVDKTSFPFDSLDLKVRYGATEDYSSSLPEIEIESKSGSTITLKEYNASYAPTGYLFIENLCLGSTHGEVNVKAKLKDRFEAKIQQTTPSQIVALNDQKPPYFKGGSAGSKNDKGLTTVNYSYSTGTATENVWPRPRKEGIKSTEFWDSPNIVNGDGVPVRWFYTNALIGDDYCVRLNLDLVEEKKDIKIYSKKHSSSLLSDDDLKNISTNNCNATLLTTLTNKSSYDYTFETGTYTVYLEDSVGNKSPAYTFAVVEDSTGPEMVTSEGRDLKHLITVPSGVTGQPTYQFGNRYDENWGRSTTVPSGGLFYDWWDATYHNTTNMWGRRCALFGTMEQIKNAKLVVKLSGDATGSERTIYEDSSVPTNGSQSPKAGEYWKDAKLSRTSSGISQYYICRVYAKWRCEKGDDLFTPSFPPDTNVEDRYVDDIKKYTNASFTSTTTYNKYVSDVSKRTYAPTYKPNTTYYTNYFDDWQPYTAGTNIEIPIFKDYRVTTNRVETINNKKYDVYWQPPITLCFKDNCGNLNYIVCTRPDWVEYSTWVYRIHVEK